MLYLIFGVIVGAIAYGIAFSCIDWKKTNKEDILYTMLIMEMTKK